MVAERIPEDQPENTDPEDQPEKPDPKAKGNALAVAALAKADGDWKAAAKIMSGMIAADPVLEAELTRPWLNQAIWYYIRHAASNRRTSLWRNPSDETATPPIERGTDDGTEGLRLMALRTLMDYPLSHGWKLGDADAELLTDEAEMMEKPARTTLMRASWLRLIAKGLKGKQTVRTRYTDAQLQALQTQAEKKAGI